jgi:hypothetical protein
MLFISKGGTTGIYPMRRLHTKASSLRWIILNSGGGPTPDKPEVLLETPSDPNRVSSFLSLRVADIWACYKQWGDKGALFLTEPLDNHGWEWRCYMRDPDGYLIEVGQYAQLMLDRFKDDANWM